MYKGDGHLQMLHKSQVFKAQHLDAADHEVRLLCCSITRSAVLTPGCCLSHQQRSDTKRLCSAVRFRSKSGGARSSNGPAMCNVCR
jgi:hypothetical protein